MRESIGRYKTWLNRLQTYLSPLNFIMVLLPMGTKPGEKLNKTVCKLKIGYYYKKIILLFGFIGESKGYDTVIKTLMYLPDEYIILIIGSCRNHNSLVYKEKLVSMVNSLRLTDRVKFLGNIDNKELNVFFNAAVGDRGIVYAFEPEPKTKKEWSQHLIDSPDGFCVDCLSGIVPKFNKKDEVVDWGYY